MTVRGEGEFIKTLLLPGQAPKGSGSFEVEFQTITEARSGCGPIGRTIELLRAAHRRMGARPEPIVDRTIACSRDSTIPPLDHRARTLNQAVRECRSPVSPWPGTHSVTDPSPAVESRASPERRDERHARSAASCGRESRACFFRPVPDCRSLRSVLPGLPPPRWALAPSRVALWCASLRASTAWTSAFGLPESTS